MNIDINSLTLGQIKELQSLFSGTPLVETAVQNPMIGKYVIARCYAAGVHAGDVASVDGDTVILKISRRLWSWKAKDGVALSGLAQTGPQSGYKIDTLNPEIYLTGVCELIPCASGVKESINAYK